MYHINWDNQLMMNIKSSMILIDDQQSSILVYRLEWKIRK